MLDCVFNNLGWNNPCLDEVAMFSLPRWLLTICWLWATQGHLGGPLRQLAVASYNKPRAILNCIRFSLCSVNRAWPSFELCQWLMKVMISNTSVKFGLLWHLWNRNPWRPIVIPLCRGPPPPLCHYPPPKVRQWWNIIVSLRVLEIWNTKRLCQLWEIRRHVTLVTYTGSSSGVEKIGLEGENSSTSVSTFSL